MKRREWRKIRAGQGLEGHHLAQQPLDAAARNVSEAMVRVLRLALAREHVTGSSLRAWNVSTKQLEALAKRGLVDVEWARVPHRAPLDVKVERVRVSERGRALLAVWDLQNASTDVDVEYTSPWAPPPGVKSVIVTGLGGGGGGGGGAGVAGVNPRAYTAAQVAQAINQSVPGVTASAVSPNGVSIGTAQRGPVGTTKRISSAAEFRSAFGDPGTKSSGRRRK